MYDRTSPLTSPSTDTDEHAWADHLDEEARIIAELGQRIEQQEEELRELRALHREHFLRESQIMMMAGDTRLPITARLVGIYLRVRYQLFPRVSTVGQEMLYPVPVRVRMLEVADALGIHSRTIGTASKLVASAGYLTRECRTVWEEDQPRCHIYLASGPGHSASYVVAPRHDYQAAYREHERAERAEREASYKRDIEELKAAATYAREMGCPVCGGALAPTGYYCQHCNAEQPTALLASLPLLDEATTEESE